MNKRWRTVFSFVLFSIVFAITAAANLSPTGRAVADFSAMLLSIYTVIVLPKKYNTPLTTILMIYFSTEAIEKLNQSTWYLLLGSEYADGIREFFTSMGYTIGDLYEVGSYVSWIPLIILTTYLNNWPLEILKLFNNENKTVSK